MSYQQIQPPSYPNSDIEIEIEITLNPPPPAEADGDLIPPMEAQMSNHC
jgi:hypothetical protein